MNCKGFTGNALLVIIKNSNMAFLFSKKHF